MQVVAHNAEYNILVDEMGLPLPHSTVAWLIDQAFNHMKRSSLEMEAIAKRLVQENAPSMESQLNWEFYTEGFDSKSGTAALKAYLEAHNGPKQE